MANNVYEIVKKHIDEYDYMALLSSGCPADEFDIESRRISTAINAHSTIAEIAQVIAHTFEEYFDHAQKPEAYIQVAKNIHQDLNRK